MKINLYLKENLKPLFMINSCKTKVLEPKKVETPIKCWKIFHIKGGEYYGPFTKYKYSDIREGKHIYPKEGETSIKYNHDNKWFDITSGFIHTLSYLPSNNLCLEMGNKEFDNYVNHDLFVELWECEIPKGAIYFQADTRGSHSETNNSYASTKIKLVKLIKRFEF